MVRAAKKAGQLAPETAEQAGAYDLTLDQLAELADWQDDPDAVAELVAAAPAGRWDHTRARLTRDRKAQQTLAKEAKRLQAQGLRVINDDPSYYEAPVYLRAITTSDGQDITDEDHAGCPGHAVTVCTDDWSGRITTDLVCTDPEQYGHLYRHTRQTSTDSGPLTEEQRTARRELVARNKEMLAAQDVRRAFVQNQAGSRKHSKTQTDWAIAGIVGRGWTITDLYSYGPNQVLKQLLDTEDIEGTTAALPPTRHTATLWLMVCATYEAALPKDAHRSPTADQAAYLTHLIALGYTPCDSEQLIINAIATK